MNIFIIPSWYPSPHMPNSGVFFREQALIYARHFEKDNIGIANWGAKDERLLLNARQFYRWPEKIFAGFRLTNERNALADNCVEYFNPSFTWSRRFLDGNLKNITQRCIESFRSFGAAFGTSHVIHAHVSFPGGYIAKEMSKHFKVPYLITEHMSPFPMPGLHFGFEKYVLSPLLATDQVLTVSKELQSQIAKYDVESKVLPNFIDDGFFIPSLKKEASEPFGFLSIGRLEKQKGFGFLIEACHSLIERNVDFELKIIGEGSLRESLEQRIKEYGLSEKVKLLGSKAKEEIKQHLQHCDAFIQPSLHESFGVAALEALAFGKPVIGTGVGELSNMITDETGISIVLGDSASIAEAMIRMITQLESYDQSKIRAFYEERYLSSKTTKSLREIYKQVAFD